MSLHLNYPPKTEKPLLATLMAEEELPGMCKK